MEMEKNMCINLIFDINIYIKTNGYQINNTGIDYLLKLGNKLEIQKIIFSKSLLELRDLIYCYSSFTPTYENGFISKIKLTIDYLDIKLQLVKKLDVNVDYFLDEFKRLSDYNIKMKKSVVCTSDILRVLETL